MLFTNILTSNLSPTDSDRLKWWSRFAHFTIVIKALVPTGNIYWVCGKGVGRGFLERRVSHGILRPGLHLVGRSWLEDKTQLQSELFWGGA